MFYDKQRIIWIFSVLKAIKQSITILYTILLFLTDSFYKFVCVWAAKQGLLPGHYYSSNRILIFQSFSLPKCIRECDPSHLLQGQRGLRVYHTFGTFSLLSGLRHFVLTTCICTCLCAVFCLSNPFCRNVRKPKHRTRAVTSEARPADTHDEEEEEQDKEEQEKDANRGGTPEKRMTKRTRTRHDEDGREKEEDEVPHMKQADDRKEENGGGKEEQEERKFKESETEKEDEEEGNDKKSGEDDDEEEDVASELEDNAKNTG